MVRLHGYFEYLYPKNKLEDFLCAIQRVLADKITDGKIKVTLITAKRVEAIHGMTDPGIRDKVLLIIKAKIEHKNNMQDEVEVLPDN